MTPKYTNALAGETSPYLLQHAHNPVDWYPWSDEIFEMAKEQDKPVLVSIGYSACHWCHVMGRESFEDPEVANVMNESFINIKVDREERPDVDHIYMDIVQALTGSGGWPLNVFLTPDGRPFYGGTYYPPTPMYNRLSWLQLLTYINEVYHTKRDDVEAQANKLLQHLQHSEQVFSTTVQPDGPVVKKDVDTLLSNIKNQFDTNEGGFGGAPKFPGTLSLQFLLRYHYLTGNKEALEHVNLSLHKMCMGGIYDQVGGGFARYATDGKWLVPHF